MALPNLYGLIIAKERRVMKPNKLILFTVIAGLSVMISTMTAGCQEQLQSTKKPIHGLEFSHGDVDAFLNDFDIISSRGNTISVIKEVKDLSSVGRRVAFISVFGGPGKRVSFAGNEVDVDRLILTMADMLRRKGYRKIKLNMIASGSSEWRR
jgi:hypothetical protein